jgi:hypothetical protein
MAVYVSCCNAQSKSHSDPLDISCYLYSIDCPTIIYLPSLCYLSYGETQLVNCGPRSYFFYIAITCLLYSHCLLYLHTTIAFHSIRLFLCLQQTGEIDNLIISWEQSSWLCCVQVPRCSWQSKPLDEAPYKLSRAVAKLASITFWSIGFFLLDWHTLVSYWGKTCCYIHQNLLLGFPNWAVIYIIITAPPGRTVTCPLLERMLDPKLGIGVCLLQSRNYPGCCWRRSHVPRHSQLLNDHLWGLSLPYPLLEGLP